MKNEIVLFEAKDGWSEWDDISRRGAEAQRGSKV